MLCTHRGALNLKIRAFRAAGSFVTRSSSGVDDIH